MENTEQEMEIAYVHDYQDFKRVSLHPSTITSIICCNIIPITGTLIFELVMLIISLQSGFSWIRISIMIVVPSLCISVIILYTPTYIIILKYQWKKISKLPLERKWIFTNKGIIVDKTYTSTKFDWEKIHKVVESRKAIHFNLTNNKVINLVLDSLPKSALNEEQYGQLHTILQKYLDSSKIKFKIDKEAS